VRSGLTIMAGDSGKIVFADERRILVKRRSRRAER
jgi:hypothetical protein